MSKDSRATTAGGTDALPAEPSIDALPAEPSPSRLAGVFASGKAFIPFITGGDPDIETTERLLYALQEAGADAIEIGIPFSDPTAEGPVIEAANARALKAGCTPQKLFDLVARVRKDIKIPLLFMTYYNPVFFYGPEAFAARCSAVGVDGLIVCDLPFDEREELYASCSAQGVELISLIAPTSKSRIKRIAENSSGFLYCVSSLGVTGERQTLGDSARHMIEQVRQTSSIPCAVGFGIATPEQAQEVARFADGVIIGSAIVRIIGQQAQQAQQTQQAQQGQDCVGAVAQFAREIKQAISIAT